MKRSELVTLLNTLPDEEVRTLDGALVTGATADTYDTDDAVDLPCITLEEE